MAGVVIGDGDGEYEQPSRQDAGGEETVAIQRVKRCRGCGGAGSERVLTEP
jgi:hypothetical protein